MRQTLRRILLLAVSAILATSCGTYKKFVLMNDIKAPETYAAPERHDLKIKKGDVLQIHVTHKDPKMVEAFNRITRAASGAITSSNEYQVNNDGFVNFPILDTVKVTGMTCSELESYLARRMADEGVVKDATVSAKIANFQVTVIGESGTGIHKFENEGATLLDLVAQAGIAGGSNGNGTTNGGGMNIRRDKILVVRDCDSVLTTATLNLLKKDVMYSPYFFLQQNDIIYVYPSQTSIWSSNQKFDWWWNRLNLITGVSSLVTMVLVFFQNRTTTE